jgi:hypothetical protein
MTVTSLLLATTLAATAAAAINSTMTSAPTTLQTAPSRSSNANVITTSVPWADGNVASEYAALDLPADSLTLQGSIVTVNPSGTVIKIACPFATATAAAADDVCSVYDALNYLYTLRPGFVYNHVAYQTSMYGVSGEATADSSCTVTNSDLACVEVATIKASGAGQSTSTVSTTTTTYTDPTYTPLYITAGLDKARPVPTQGTGAAGSLKVGSALAGAAAAIAVAALAI